jgi:hypothetical protein
MEQSKHALQVFPRKAACASRSFNRPRSGFEFQTVSGSTRLALIVLKANLWTGKIGCYGKSGKLVTHASIYTTCVFEKKKRGLNFETWVVADKT